jgi:ubiquitin-protein ligase
MSTEAPSIAESFEAAMKQKWDPDEEGAGSFAPLSAEVSARVKRDLLAVFREPIDGVLVVPTDDIRLVWACIVGPEGTPYSGAPFIFKIRFLSSYPSAPPRCRLMTTHGGTVRFGPNLYANGKVCLSILGTWTGGSWLPSFSLSTLLVNLQSLLSPRAATLEPGHEAAPEAEVAGLNDALEHETLRVAVLGQLGEGAGAGAAAAAGGGGAPAYLESCPELLDAVRENFLLGAEAWAGRARALARTLDGTPFRDPRYARVRAGEASPVFRFAELADSIQRAFLRAGARADAGASEGASEGAGEGAGVGAAAAAAADAAS